MKITPIKNYSDKDLNFKFYSPENKYTISFLDIVEPNNGRLLREVKAAYNGADITAELYGNWNFTDLIEFDKFEFSSSDGGHLFFPSEDSFIVYDTKTNAKIKFHKSHSFDLNYFDKNFLFILGQNKLTVIDLFNNKSEEIETDFIFDFAFFKESELYFLSLEKGLYQYDKSKKTFELINNIELPKNIFPNDYYKEFEIVSNDKNRGFTFALGVKTLNKKTKNYHINSWNLVSRQTNNKLIIGTNVPEKTEKLKDTYSYTYWFYGNARYATLDY